MANLLSVVIIGFVVSAAALPYANKETLYPFPFVSREEWGARPSGPVMYLGEPAPFVVIHHTYIPTICLTRDDCESKMRSMQNTHQITNGWEDIGYNFAVGGEGSVYEGRGWDVVGAHAVGYNVRSVGICLIGDFISNLPPQAQLDTAKALINTGVELGYISPDYQLVGHRQVGDTECPGDALFNEISTWNKFTMNLN